MDPAASFTLIRHWVCWQFRSGENETQEIRLKSANGPWQTNQLYDCLKLRTLHAPNLRGHAYLLTPILICLFSLDGKLNDVTAPLS